MTQDLSIVTLVTQASLVVQLVMAGLAFTSLASWTVIFAKIFGLRGIRGEGDYVAGHEHVQYSLDVSYQPY